MRVAGNRRLAGAVAGAATPGVIAALSWWLGFSGLMGITAAGIPIGSLVGWWLGPRAAAPGRALATWLVAAFSAVVVAIVAVAVIGLVGLITGERAGPLTIAGAGVYLLPLVIAYALVFGLPVTLPVAAAWTALVRLVAARPRLGWSMVGVMAIVAVGLGLGALRFGPTLEARMGDGLLRAGSPPIVLALARTEVRWMLRNCAAWPYAVAVPSRPLLGGPAEARWAAGPHATSSGSTVVEPGWTLEVEPDASAPLPSAYLGPKRVLDDVPGRIVEVEVEVGPSGDWSYQVQVDGGRNSTIVSVCRQAG